jgi:catechol 2,3-dioxygenase
LAISESVVPGRQPRPIREEPGRSSVSARWQEFSVAEREPNYDIAHLARVELLTPKPQESLAFFTDVFGMVESGRAGDSVYLRGWDDYERATLKLTAAKQAGLGHFAFRTTSRAALDRRAKALEAAGAGRGWSKGDLGHGPAFVTETPDGHRIELYWETEWYSPPPELKPALKNQAQKFLARGMNVRRLDHLNLLASDVGAVRKFLEDYLGMRLTEQIVLDDGTEAASWVTATNKSYDVAIARDHTGARGRLHHFTYALDSREDVLRAADIALEHGVFIETGPHKHAIQQTFFLYLYEPGGNRVEVASAGARLILAPDWKPVIWSQAERAKGQAWGLKTVESFHSYGTPPVEPVVAGTRAVKAGRS